jgi:hypothetical protein
VITLQDHHIVIWLKRGVLLHGANSLSIPLTRAGENEASTSWLNEVFKSSRRFQSQRPEKP